MAPLSSKAIKVNIALMMMICILRITGAVPEKEVMVSLPPNDLDFSPTYIRAFHNTAVHVPYPDLNYVYTEEYEMFSPVACATKAAVDMATGFNYQNGICYLYESGNHTGITLESVFYGVPYFLPLDTLENIAVGKTVHASPHYLAGIKSKLIDGNVNSFYATHAMNAWAVIDILETRHIHQVLLIPRVDCCYERNTNLEVRIGNTLITNGDLSSYTLLGFFEGPYAAEYGYLAFSSYAGISGRYVSVQITGFEQKKLAMGEVGIMAKRL